MSRIGPFTTTEPIPPPRQCGTRPGPRRPPFGSPTRWTPAGNSIPISYSSWSSAVVTAPIVALRTLGLPASRPVRVPPSIPALAASCPDGHSQPRAACPDLLPNHVGFRAVSDHHFRSPYPAARSGIARPGAALVTGLVEVASPRRCELVPVWDKPEGRPALAPSSSDPLQPRPYPIRGLPTSRLTVSRTPGTAPGIVEAGGGPQRCPVVGIGTTSRMHSPNEVALISDSR